jgi:hypothetical protein
MNKKTITVGIIILCLGFFGYLAITNKKKSITPTIPSDTANKNTTSSTTPPTTTSPSQNNPPANAPTNEPNTFPSISNNETFPEVPVCVKNTYTAKPNYSKVIVYIDCDGNPQKTTLLDGSLTLNIRQDSDLSYDVPFQLDTKVKLYPEYPVTTKADPSIVLPQELHNKGFYEGAIVTPAFYQALVAYNDSQSDVLNQQYIKAAEKEGGYNYITESVTANNATNIVAQILEGIENGSVFTPQGDIALLSGTKDFQFIVNAAEAGLVNQDLMSNLQSLGVQATTISQSEVNDLNQAMQDAQDQSNNTLSNADIYNVCMQNATTSLQQEYCKNTAASADAR